MRCGLSFAFALVIVTGCATTGPAGGDDATEVPFEPDPPAVYVAKVKNLLVGLPPSDAEVASVVADPAALGDLIRGWIATPEYERKMLRFFQLAFQQTQITRASFIDISDIGLGLSRTVLPELLVQNMQESYARTVLDLIARGRPFTEAITTKQLMMTTPLMEWYAYLDTVTLDNDGRRVDLFPSMVSNKTVFIGSAPVPLDRSLDRNSASFMHFTDPKVATMRLTDPSCNPLSYDPNGRTGTKGATGLHNWFYGLLTDNNWISPTGVTCRSASTAPGTVFFTPDDFASWRLITLRRPGASEQVSEFWNIPALRTATELRLQTPRQGFFSTPAFHANWSTNGSNQMRVTAHQSLIVALGESLDGTDQTEPATTPGLDETHAGGGTCYGCHKLLDPMRSVLAASYSWGYGRQSDPVFANQPGQFAWQGVISPMSNLDDFATALATHPHFARAWVQKLCYYANSAPCALDDPELQRIVAAFEGSNFQWNELIRELFASPLITHAAKTQTAATNGVVVAVSRLDHLCAALDHRLGLADACVLDPLDKVPPPRTSVIEQIAGGLPSDGYGRGAPAPVLPNAPTLFFRAAVEHICAGIADQVIDGATPKWTSAGAEAAIPDLVAVMMGLTASDPRTAEATALLRSHFDDAVAAGHTRADALKSTFVVSCLAPSFIAIGM